jgi:MFS family permease
MPGEALSSSLRRLIGASGVNSFGNGLVLPILLIYLHRVRHIPLATTGLLLTLPALLGLLTVPLSGSLMDRVGARRVLRAALSAQAAGQLLIAWSHSAVTAVPGLILQGVGLAPTFPAYNMMVARLAPDAGQQQRAFGVNFTVINASIGLGGLVSAAVVDVARPGTFQSLFVGNAASCVATAVLLRLVPPPAPVVLREMGQQNGYRRVLTDRNLGQLRRLLVLTLLLAMTGYAALDAGLPAYANVVAGVSAKVVALSLAANTLTIVAFQLFVLRRLRGHRRSHALSVVGAVWLVSWALFGASPAAGGPFARSAVVLAFAAVFGLGETFMAPTLAPLTNTLAPEVVRGRVNALSSGTFSIAFVLSPAISAGFISAGLGGVWIGLLCLGCIGVVVLGLRLGGRLSAAVDAGRPDVPPVRAEPAPVPSNGS